MLGKSALIAFVLGAFASTSVAAEKFPQKFNKFGEELRLIKTSEFDNGTWYTQQQILDIFISTPSCAHFQDITETMVWSA